MFRDFHKQNKQPKQPAGINQFSFQSNRPRPGLPLKVRDAESDVDACQPCKALGTRLAQSFRLFPVAFLSDRRGGQTRRVCERQ